MKRESIIKLMWISLGIHVGHFLLEGIVAMGQRQIMALSMAPDFEGTVFPVPYLLAGSAVYLVIHGILTGISGEYRTGKLLHYQSGALIFQSDSYSGHQPADTGERDVDVL